jgi:hypothetical protein
MLLTAEEGRLPEAWAGTQMLYYDPIELLIRPKGSLFRAPLALLESASQALRGDRGQFLVEGSGRPGVGHAMPFRAAIEEGLAGFDAYVGDDAAAAARFAALGPEVTRRGYPEEARARYEAALEKRQDFEAREYELGRRDLTPTTASTRERDALERELTAASLEYDPTVSHAEQYAATTYERVGAVLRTLANDPAGARDHAVLAGYDGPADDLGARAG